MQNNIPFSVLMLQVEAKALEMVSESMIFFLGKGSGEML